MKRLEHRPAEGGTRPSRRSSGRSSGQPPRVPADVDHPGVAAAGDDDQALVLDVDDKGLVVREPAGPAPSAPPSQACCGGRAGLVPGGPRHLPGHQHGPVEQEAGLALLDHLEARPGQRPAARRVGTSCGSAPRGSSPGGGGARTAGGSSTGRFALPSRRIKPVQAGGVVEVAVAADDGLEARRIDLEPVHVPDHPVGAGAGVVQDLVPGSRSWPRLRAPRTRARPAARSGPGRPP